MTTPALGAVRTAFPYAEIVVAANPTVAELFSPHPHCDRVLIWDKKGAHRGLRGLLSFGAQLRRESFDLAILFQNAIEAAILSVTGGIPRRMGYRTDGRGPLLTHGVRVGDAERRLHHTEYYLHMLRQEGIEGGDGRLRLARTPSERAWAEHVLGSGFPIAINPGAAYGSAKRWMPERFAALADALAHIWDAQIVLTGGPGERETGREIEQAMEVRPVNLIGKTSVRQMMAVLGHCRLVVTNDSGPMHVAAALGRPVVALFGSTDPNTTSPRGPHARIVQKPAPCAPCLKRHCPTDHGCMEAIHVEEVLQAVQEVLASASEIESDS